VQRYVGRWRSWLAPCRPAPLKTGSGRGPVTALSRLAKQRRDAARQTYQTTLANYRDGFASEELLYRWSRRWLEAERQVDKRQEQLVDVAHESSAATLRRARWPGRGSL